MGILEVKTRLNVARAVTASIAALTMSACAESTMIRSYPSGSKVFINERFAGITPLAYRVPEDEFHRDFRVRVERPGFTAVTSTLRKQTCPGRVAGGIFTFGILFLFKGSTCFADRHDFALSEVEPRTDPAAPSDETRLRRLDRLHTQGVLSVDEYRRYRDAILRNE